MNLWSLRIDEGELVYTFKEHTSAISVLKLSTDETKCFCGSWDSSVSVRYI
jgi:transcriptional activator SPT8